MGGNAMKKYNVERLSKEQYNEVVSALTATLPKKTLPIPAYKNKESFGDCDLLTTASNQEFETSLSKDFVVLGKSSNGAVTSYALRYKNLPAFQFDLIKTTESNFDFNYKYLSFNDLGNLIGRIAAAFGFKFGHDGLYLLAWFSHEGEERAVDRLKEENKTNEHAEVKREKLLIKDFDEALEFLGFDSGRFNQGFDDIEDILAFVANSKYFCKDFFLFENRNHEQRRRDNKRPTYIRALDYFNSLNNVKDRGQIKAEFKKMIAHNYPQVFSMKLAMKKECRREYIFARRLKARRVTWLYKRIFRHELRGVELGNMMKFLKNNCDRQLAVVGVPNKDWNEHLATLMKIAKNNQLKQFIVCG